MANMKALAMLDHVMLWIGRCFVGFLVIGSFINIIKSILPHSFKPEISPIDVSLMELVVACLLGLSLWYLWNPFSRSFVIVLSVFTLLISIFVLMTFDPGEMKDSEAATIWNFYSVMILGSLSMLWIACRPNLSRSELNQMASLPI
jgi:uncharacterized protein YhhL (DUF1145 family)